MSDTIEVLKMKAKYRLSDMELDMTSPKDGKHTEVRVSCDDLKQMWQSALDSGNEHRQESAWHTITWLHRLYLEQKH